MPPVPRTERFTNGLAFVASQLTSERANADGPQGDILPAALMYQFYGADFSDDVVVTAQTNLNQASIVVNFGATSPTLIRTAAFSQSMISGLEALQLTGLPVVTTEGGAVCSIGNVGCPADDCFCGCQGGDECLFWSYNNWTSDVWSPYGVGAGDSSIANGAIEGWTWGGTLLPAPWFQAGEAGLDYLRFLQNDDGSYNGFAGPDVGATLDVLLAASANSVDASEWARPGGSSLLDYLSAGSNAADYAARGPASAGKLAMGLAAAGENPHDFNGLDIIAIIEGYYDSSTGAYVSPFGSTSNWDQALAMLGIAAAEGFPDDNIYSAAMTNVSAASIPAAAVEFLRSRGIITGGGLAWDFAGSNPPPVWDAPGVDSTALVIQALVAGDVSADDATLVQALAYLENAQQENTDGGWLNSYPPAAGASDNDKLSNWSLAKNSIFGVKSKVLWQHKTKEARTSVPKGCR